MSPETSRVEQNVILDQTRYSKVNHAVKILVREHLLRMLTEVNRWLISEAKI